MLSIGIHISYNRIHFAGLSLKGQQAKLEFIEEKLIKDPRHSKDEKRILISSQIKSIEEKYPGQSLRLCYALSQNLVTSFPIDFPFKEKFKILKTLPFEIEEKTPFRPDKVFFDARICEIKGKNQSYALCFVTPEENVNEFLEFSSPLEKQPYLLSCEGSALANLLEFQNPLSQAKNPMSASFFIYLGADNSQLLFYKKGRLSHISVIDWTITSIVKEMEKLYSLTTQKAWAEFFEKSFILSSSEAWSKEQIFFSNLIKKHVNILIQKLRLLKMSLETEHKSSISKAFLFGPGAVIKNLTAFLTANIPVHFSRLEALTRGQVKLSNRPLAHIAAGLALEGLKQAPYQGLNFFQSIKKEGLSLYPKKWKKAGGIFLLCFAVWTAYSIIRKRESRLIVDKAQTVFIDFGKKIAGMRESQVRVESIKSFLKKEKNKLKSEELIQKELSQPNPIDHLQRMSQKLGPAGQWKLSLHYVKLEGRNMEIKGWIDSPYLGKFKSHLESLAEGPIKESYPEDSKNPSSSETDHLKQTKSEPDHPLKDKLKSPGTLPESHLNQRSFFSYSLQFKEES